MKKENKKVFAKIMVMVMALSLLGANGSMALAGDARNNTENTMEGSASGNAVAAVEATASGNAETEERITLEKQMPEALVRVSGLPVGSSIVVKTLTEAFDAETEMAMKEKIAAEANVTIDEVIAYDITVFDENGSEWQPSENDEVHVQFILNDKNAEAGDAYWVSDDAEEIETVETVETNEDAAVDMVATHFSTYGTTTGTTNSNWKPLKIFVREARSGKYTKIGASQYAAISNEYVSGGETKTFDFTYYPDVADKDKNEIYNVSGFYNNRAEMDEVDARIREIVSGVYGESALNVLNTLDNSDAHKYVCAKLSIQSNAVHLDVVYRNFTDYEKVWFLGYLIKKNSNGAKWSKIICEGYFKEGLAPRINKESETDNQQVENTIAQFVFEDNRAKYADPVNMYAEGDYYYTADTITRYGIHVDWVKANLCGSAEWHVDGKVVGANGESYDNKTIVVYDLVKDGETTHLGYDVIDKNHILTDDEISEEIKNQTFVENYTEPVWTVDGEAYTPGEKAFTMQVGGNTVAADEKHITITINRIEETQNNTTGNEPTTGSEPTTSTTADPVIGESQIMGGIVPGMTDGLGQIMNDVENDMNDTAQTGTTQNSIEATIPYIPSVIVEEEPEVIFVPGVNKPQEEVQQEESNPQQEVAEDKHEEVENLQDDAIVPLDESAKRSDVVENEVAADVEDSKAEIVANANVELTVIEGEKVAKSDRAEAVENKETKEIKNWTCGATNVAEVLDDFVRHTTPVQGALPLGLAGVAVLGVAGFVRISVIGKRR